MQKKMFLAALLVAFMIMLLALPASAAETSGNCGANMTWVYDATTKTLTISGAGEMNAGEQPEWRNYRNSVMKIVINEGVTSISERAFSFFTNVTSVSLPKSLRYIEEEAFRECSNLRSISLPNITTIGNSAFESCSKLTELIIPASVKIISFAAFRSCSGLTNIIFPNTLTEIGGEAFEGCGSLVSVTIPDSVRIIGGGAFRSCIGLSDVTLGKNLNLLEGGSFRGCDSLERIQIPDKVRSLGSYALGDCKNLKEVSIGAAVAEIDSSAFDGCTNLGAFMLSSKNNFFSVDNGALYTKDKRELVLIPYGYTGKFNVCPGTVTIRECAAEFNLGLTEVSFPESLRVISRHVFRGCSNLREITIAEGLEKIETSAFEGTSIQRVVLPSTLNALGYTAFGNCASLTEITFKGNAPDFDVYVFRGAKANVTYYCSKIGWEKIINYDPKYYVDYDGYLRWKSAEYVQQIIPGKEATCTNEGQEDGVCCATCGRITVAPKTISMLEHRYDVGKCIDEETHLLTCVGCGDEKTMVHNYTTEITLEATCKDAGTQVHTCNSCKYMLTETISISKNGHVYDNSCDTECNLCSALRKTTHRYSMKWLCDETSHWRLCDVCKTRIDEAQHTFNLANADGIQPCAVCEFEILAPTEPIESNDGSRNFHWWLLPLGGAVVCAVVLIMTRKKG